MLSINSFLIKIYYNLIEFLQFSYHTVGITWNNQLSESVEKFSMGAFLVLFNNILIFWLIDTKAHKSTVYCPYCTSNPHSLTFTRRLQPMFFFSSVCDVVWLIMERWRERLRAIWFDPVTQKTVGTHTHTYTYSPPPLGIVTLSCL